MKTQKTRERRFFERTPVIGAAAVLDFGFLGQVYELEDLSLGGAKLRGVMPAPDASFEILLHVANRYVERHARQVWRDRDGEGSIGIEFEGVDVRSTLDWPEPLDEEVAGYHGLASSPAKQSALLILDKETCQASAFARSLETLGVDPIVVCSPLEAISLIESERKIDIVFISPGLPGCRGGELACFIAESYPDIRRVLLDTGDHYHGPLAGAERVLTRPWNLRAIEAALKGLLRGHGPGTMASSYALS